MAGLPGLASPWCGVPCFCRAYGLAGPGRPGAACRLRIPDLWEGLPGKSQLGNAAALVWGPIRPRGVDALLITKDRVPITERNNSKFNPQTRNRLIYDVIKLCSGFPEEIITAMGDCCRWGCTAILISDESVDVAIRRITGTIRSLAWHEISLVRPSPSSLAVSSSYLDKGIRGWNLLALHAFSRSLGIVSKRGEALPTTKSHNLGFKFLYQGAGVVAQSMLSTQYLMRHMGTA